MVVRIAKITVNDDISFNVFSLVLDFLRTGKSNV